MPELLLNPVQIADLEKILDITVKGRRVEVMLAFSGLTVKEWAQHTGMFSQSVGRWLLHRNRMPFGAAYKLAGVIGIAPDILFADYL